MLSVAYAKLRLTHTSWDRAIAPVRRSSRVYAFLASVLCGLSSSPLSAEDDGILGTTWLTANGGSAMKFYACEAAPEEVCGKVVWMRRRVNPETGETWIDEPPCVDEYCGQALFGMELIRGLRPTEDEKRPVWSDGRIYDPNTGKLYSIRIRRKKDKLHLRGYVGLTLFGRTTVWTKTAIPPEDSKARADDEMRSPQEASEDPTKS